jgi:hypothetical protein
MPLVWTLAALASAPARAAEGAGPVDARALMRQALEAQATMPARPPALPDQASARAVEAHRDTAFGKKGEAERAAHRHAVQDGRADAGGLRAEAANRAAAGVAAGLGEGHGSEGESHSAAGMKRSRGKGVGGPPKEIAPEVTAPAAAPSAAHR